MITTGLAVALALAGCAGREQPLPPVPEINQSMRAQGAAFAAALGEMPVRGTVLYPAVWEFYRTRPEKLVERVQALGLNRIYLVLSSTDELRSERGEQLAALAGRAAAADVDCELLLQQRDYVPRRSGNVFQRKFGVPRPLHEAAVQIGRFLSGPGARFSGVTVAAEIHLFTLASPELPSNALYLWSEKAYGAGRDNDILMRQLLADLKDFRQTLGAVHRFTVAVPDFYHDRAMRGDLGCGRIGDFLAFSDFVMVIGTGSRPTDYADSVQEELKAAGDRPGSVLMGVYLAAHSSENRVALRRRDWADFVRIVEYLRERAQVQPAFGGMAIAPWSSLELLWEK